jgi:hypothetical protein
MSGYEYWENALEGRFGPVTEMPECGFYRMKSAGNLWLPVAFYPANQGAVYVQIGKGDPAISEDDPGVSETWLRCAKFPVEEDAYRHAMKNGLWPGDAPAERGHNNPPDGLDALIETLKSQAAEVGAWLKGRKIETQADADRCETWANDFLKLKKQAEAEHKTEKDPHLKAGREVDAKYKPLVDLASKCARALKDAATAYLVARQAEKRQAAAQSIARGDPAPVRTELRATTTGTSGRKLSLREHKWAEVTDWPAAVAYFAQDPEIRALVQRRADKLAEIGAAVPWATFKSEQRAA